MLSFELKRYAAAWGKSAYAEHHTKRPKKGDEVPEGDVTAAEVVSWAQDLHDEVAGSRCRKVLGGPGHIVGQITAPRVISELVQVGLIRDQTRWMLDILDDPLRTGVAVVTTPEEMPVTETIDLLGLDDVAVVGHDSGGMIARHAVAGDRGVDELLHLGGRELVGREVVVPQVPFQQPQHLVLKDTS